MPGNDTTEFINRHVFPDAQLETISTVQQVIEEASSEIHDVESLRLHYALTLREWVIVKMGRKSNPATSVVSYFTFPRSGDQTQEATTLLRPALLAS